MTFGQRSTAVQPAPAPATWNVAVQQRNALGVPGFGSHLDCNKVYKDYEQIMIQAGLQGHKTAEPDADTKPNALPLQKLTIGPVSSGDALTLYKLAQGLGLVEAGLYKAERIGGQIMQILTIGPVRAATHGSLCAVRRVGAD